MVWSATTNVCCVEDGSGALDHDDGAADAVDAVVAHTTQEHPVQSKESDQLVSFIHEM